MVDLVHPVAAWRDRSRQTRAALAGAAAVALVVLCCVAAAQGSRRTTSLVQEAVLNAGGTTSSEKPKMKVATGTLALFDTSGVDHDGEKWAPKPKLSPGAQKQELLNQEKKSLLAAEKQISDKSLAESASKEGNVDVRNAPEIKEQEKALEQKDAEKASDLMSTHEERADQYKALVNSEKDKNAQYKDYIKSMRDKTEAYRAKIQHLKETGDDGSEDDTDPDVKDGDYNDWYNALYAKSLKKEFQRKKDFVNALASKDNNPYDQMYQAALKHDEERQNKMRAQMTVDDQGMKHDGDGESGSADAGEGKDVHKEKEASASEKDQAAIDKQVQLITGGIDKIESAKCDGCAEDGSANSAKAGDKEGNSGDATEKQSLVKQREAAEHKEGEAVKKEERKEANMKKEKIKLREERQQEKVLLKEEDEKEAKKEAREKAENLAMRKREEKEIRAEERDEEKSEEAMKARMLKERSVADEHSEEAKNDAETRGIFQAHLHDVGQPAEAKQGWGDKDKEAAAPQHAAASVSTGTVSAPAHESVDVKQNLVAGGAGAAEGKGGEGEKDIVAKHGKADVVPVPEKEIESKDHPGAAWRGVVEEERQATHPSTTSAAVKPAKA